MKYVSILGLFLLAACTNESSYPDSPNYSQSMCFSIMGNGWKANQDHLEKTGICPKKG